MAPILTAISPTSGASNQSTNQPIVLSVVGSGAESIREETIKIAVNGTVALNSEQYPTDGAVTRASSILLSNNHSFSSEDIGKTIYTEGLTNNSGKAYLTAISGVDSNLLTVERAEYSFTFSVNNGSPSVTTSSPYGTEIQVGYGVIINDVQYTVFNLTGASTFDLTVNYAGTTDPTATARPTFQENESALTWYLHSFQEGFSGDISEIVQGYEITIFPVTQLTGYASSDGTTLSGYSSKFREELNDSANIVLANKRTNQPAVNVTSITNNISAACVYPATTTRLAYRTTDLPGIPTALTTINVSVFAVQTDGEFVDSYYSFTTSTRPKIAVVQTEEANPYGYGIRIVPSEQLRLYSATLHPAVQQKDCFSLTLISPAPGRPTPTVPTILAATATATYIDLTLSDSMQAGALYQITLNPTGIQASSTCSFAVGEAYNSAQFTGYGTSDYLEIYKDSRVATPVISGPSVTDYVTEFLNLTTSNNTVTISAGTTKIQIELNNLDPDVVALELGDSSRGVRIVDGSFSNLRDGEVVNGIREAGTGVVTLELLPYQISYSVSLIAVDDVDNISDESNLINILVRSSTIPGPELLIEPEPYPHQEVCERMLANIPDGTFSLSSSGATVVPFTYDPYPFRVKVVEVGAPISIVISRESSYPQAQTIQSFVPEQLTSTVSLQLGQGRNLIAITDGVSTKYIQVRATVQATIICAQAMQLHDRTLADLKELQNALYSETATRVAEPYVEYADIVPFPNVQSQKVLAMKMAIRSLVSDSGLTRGVIDTNTAMFLQTPFVSKTELSKRWFYPNVYRLRNSQENFGGVDHHTWIHNFCVGSWGTGMRYISSGIGRYLSLETNENESIIKEQFSGRIVRNMFDFYDPSCNSLSAISTCFEDVSVDVFARVNSGIQICAASYPFDSCFSTSFPLGSGRLTFDSDHPWDSGLPLDYDLLDPGDDGWAGFCWADRWDSGTVEGSFSADGNISADSFHFETAGAYSFSQDDRFKWVKITSGTRTGLYRIRNVIDADTVRLDTMFDLAEVVDWQLVSDVRVLDSYGVVSSEPLDTLVGDGSVSSGSNVFTSYDYYFTSGDIGKNITISNSSEGYPISVTVKSVLDPQNVRVWRHNGSGFVDYEFQSSETGLDWKIWNSDTPRCGWDGYANKLVVLSSADCQVNLNAEITVYGDLDHEPAGVTYAVGTLNGYASVVAVGGLPVSGSASVVGEASVSGSGSVSYAASGSVSGVAGLWGLGSGGTEVAEGPSADIVGEAWCWAEAYVMTRSTLMGTASVSGSAAVESSFSVSGAATVLGTAEVLGVASVA